MHRPVVNVYHPSLEAVTALHRAGFAAPVSTVFDVNVKAVFEHVVPNVKAVALEQLSFPLCENVVVVKIKNSKTRKVFNKLD